VFVKTRKVTFWLIAEPKRRIVFQSFIKKFEGGVDMCKKSFVALLVLAMSLVASAAPSPASPLLIDLNGDNTAGDTTRTQPGWEAWNLERAPSSTTISQEFSQAFVSIAGIRADGTLPGSRNRYNTTAENYGKAQQDLFFVGHSSLTTALNGLDYLKMTFNFGSAAANTPLTFTMWAWDPAFAGSQVPGFGGAGEPPGSKNAVYSLTNPATWLTSNGFPIGYDVNGMPAGLAATVLGQNMELGLNPQQEPSTAWTYSSTFTVTTDGTGKVEIYSWNHETSFSGSQHIAINAIKVVPEPTTVALLGLGGLSLLRRRK